MRYEDDETLLGLEHAKRGRRPRGGRRWTGTLGQRARAAQRLPQAVFKISSYSRSAGAVWDRVNYVARAGELAVEGPNGERVESPAELERIVDTWSDEAKAGAGRRIAMSAVVSFPAGVDQEQATAAARQFFQAAFADNHEYVFAPHTDATQFHVHVVVQTRGLDGKQLRLDRDDIQALRLLFAEKAHEQGIELDASPRWARGLAAERRSARAVEGIARRGETPGWTRVRDGLETSEAWVGGRDPTAGESQALEYARAGGRLATQIGQLESDAKKVAAVRRAVSLASFAWELAGSDREKAEAAQQTRDIVSQTERVIHDAIQGIAGGPAKQAAIRADRELAAHLRAERATQRELAKQTRTAGRDSGAEPEP